MANQVAYEKAAEAIRKAKTLVITAGAGMGVDSGLPDFRGDHGFWKAYPMYERLGINFVGAANPAHFERDPAFGWGFYGHRTNLYRETVPHEGFGMLLEWIDRYGLDYFVVTSNVDGQFQKAGFAEDRILEVHGSIHHLQCLTPCGTAIWDNREEIPVDHETMRARHIPLCLHCGDVARPNILMFGDFSWLSDRTRRQEHNFDQFITDSRGTSMVVVEMGAGTAIPTIRSTSERLGRGYGATVIRINPREPHITSPHLSIPCGALEGLRGIEAAGSDIIIRRRASASPQQVDPMQSYTFFATTGKGIEDVLAGELRALGLDGVSPETGGVSFRGTLADCYRANLWLRTANRVLLFLAEFPCTTPQELYDGVRTIPWNDLLGPDMTLAVDCTVRDSAITHSGFAALKTKDAVVDAIRERHGRRPNVETGNPDLRINVRLFRNRCTVSLDSSGDPLDRRGYRLARREAPLRETLAAALVLLAGWDGSVPFMDPMCGSGTIPIEAAMIAGKRAPGFGERNFGFTRWLSFDRNVWLKVVEEARDSALSSLPAPVIGSDVSAAALATALQNARNAGVDRLVMWQKGDMLESEPPVPGVILFNPPYGQRLGEVEELKTVYRRIGDFLKRRCTGSTAYILVGNLELAKFIGLKATRRIVLFNGPIECRLLRYELY